jgi:uncharacterized protein YndB with AHSA1/START domain
MIRPIRAIALEARIDATPAEVWNALTDVSALADWFAPHVKGEQRLGGTVEVSWDAKSWWPSTIEVWDPQRHLRWASEMPPAEDGTPQPRLTVDWLISTDAGQTVLRLVHSGFGEGASWDEQIEGTLGGWKYFLWHLDICVTRHKGTRRALVSTRRRVSVTRSALWDSLFTSGFIALTNDTKQCVLTLGERSFDGVVEMFEGPSRFAARFPSLADAILFIELEGAAPTGFHVGFWLSTFGLDAETVSDLQRSLDEVVTKLAEPAMAATL